MTDNQNSPDPGQHSNGSEDKTQDQRVLFPLLNAIGNLRDTFLVGVGTIYLLGYIIWSLTAYSLDLGLLPVLESQYLMAGVIPALILGAFSLLLINLPKINKCLIVFFSPDRVILGLRFNRIARTAMRVVFLFGIFVLVFLALDFTPYFDIDRIIVAGWRWNIWFSWIILIVTIIIVLFAFLSAPYLIVNRHGFRHRMIRILPSLQILYIALYAVVGALLLYGLYFNNLPQEFGGIGSRCAYIDFSSGDVSNHTLRALASESEIRHSTSAQYDQLGSDLLRNSSQSTPEQTDQASPSEVSGVLQLRHNVIRSRELEILFKSQSIIVVDAGRDRYELSMNIIKSINWCE